MADRLRYIGVVLFDDVEELDAVGPWEVLASWANTWPGDGYAAVCVSSDGRPVRAVNGLVLGAHHGFDDAPTFDVLVHPGGNGVAPLTEDPAYLDRVRTWAEAASLITSVCTGSLVLAAAGLLAGRPATTHWSALDRLAAADSTIEVRPDDRFVDDGDVITAAGVSAGIDMALHLVARLAGVDRARQVRRDLQYDPAPPV